MAFDIVGIDVCQDCLIFIANGEVCDDYRGVDGKHDWSDWHWSDDAEGPGDHLAAAIDSNWEGWHLHAGCSHDHAGYGEDPTLDDEDHGERDICNEGGFSWSSCDSCGSSLGGSRYPATAMRQESAP